MITAHIGTQQIDLPKDFTFELIRQSQLTSFDQLMGDCIPSISFPDTERNRNLFNNPNRFELQRNGVKEYEGLVLRDKGWAFFKGTCVLNNGFSGYARGQIGNLAKTQQNKLITDHALPTDQAFVNKENYDPAVDDFCAPWVYNPAFFANLSKTETYAEGETTILQHKHSNAGYAVNKPSESTGIYINNTNLAFDFDFDDDYDLTVVSPFLFLTKIIDRLLKLNGFFLTESEIAAESDFSKLCIYNNVDINTGESHSGTLSVAIEWLWFERALASEVISWITRDVTTFNYARLLPKTSLKEFLVGFQNLINYAFIFNSNNTVSLIDREARIIEAPQQDLDPYFTGKWELGEKKDVSLKFIQVHDDNDAFFGDFYVDLSDRAADFGADVADMYALKAATGSKLGELRRVLSEQRIYEWSSTVMLVDESINLEKQVRAWTFISIDYQPGFYNYSPEKEVVEIKTCFSTLANTLLPFTQQPGQTNLRKASEAPFTPRLLFYTGGNNAKNYTANYSLKFTGENNLIETRWKRTAEWLSKLQPAKAVFRFPANILQNFNINEKKSTRHGAFIIDRMVTQFTHAGIGATTVEVFKS